MNVTHRIELQLRSRETAVPMYLGEHLADLVGEFLHPALAGRPVAVVADEGAAAFWLEPLRTALSAQGTTPRAVYHVAPGEDSKSTEQLALLWDWMASVGLGRDSVVLALGGGMVCDLAGFAAATYMRGIPWVPVPTSLLAMADASLGGKTAVNHPRGKNLFGAFWQPELTIAAMETLTTLPDGELANGLAEVIKCGVIRDRRILDMTLEHSPRIFARDGNLLQPLIALACRVKAEIVSEDEREAGIRELLNFGHTIGHAIEAAGRFHALKHGECVAIGMVAAGRLARKLRTGWKHEHQELLEQALALCRLPLALPPHLGCTTVDLLDRMQRDKKARGGAARFVLPAGLGIAHAGYTPEESLLQDVLRTIGANP